MRSVCVCQNVPGDVCEHYHWDLRWNSLWGHEPRAGCAEMGLGTHANPATEAFGGLPYEATNRVRSVTKLAWGRMRILTPRPSVELPMKPRSA